MRKFKINLNIVVPIVLMAIISIMEAVACVRKYFEDEE